MINIDKNINELEKKMYNELKEYDFIPKYDGNSISYRDGEVLPSLAKVNLVSVARALGKIRGYGYAHNNLSLDNLLFDSDGNLVSIIGWDRVSVGKSFDDLVYIICNYVDMEENYYSNSYAIDIIISMLEVYDSYLDEYDLSYELYWYIVNRMNKLPKDSEEYIKYNTMLSFVIYYKEDLDSTHVEDI